MLDNAQWERTETQNDLSTKTVRIKLSNAAPTLSSVVLSPSSPFKPGVQLTFTGNWTDPEQQDGEQSRLFICKTSGVPSGNNCSGGNTNNWCVSSFSTTSPSTCNYTTQTSDEGTKTYYAFECDDGQGKLCSPYISGTFVVDATAPTISKFGVTPRPPSWVNSASPNVSVSWTVADNGGSYLKEVTILRCDKPTVSQCGANDWKNIKTTAAPPNSTSWSGSLSPQDTPPEGKSWYGMHVWDNAGYKTVEPPPGPLDVQVDKTSPNPPTLISPPQGSTVSIAKPTFDWSDAVDTGGSGIASYHLMVDNNQQFNNPEIDRSSITTSFFASDTDLKQGTNYWKVAAKDVAGNPEGSFSGANNFTIQLNQPPNASFNCTPGNCTVFNTEPLTFNNNSTDPDGNMSSSEWDILNYGSSPDATCPPGPVNCNHTLQSVAPNDYTMQLRVQDSAGASDTDTRSFTVKRDIVAGFMCSLDNVNFVACSSLSGKISQEEVLYLKDSSSLSEYTIVSQGASSITNRTWKINGSTFGGNTANPSTTIPTQGTITLELTAQDNQGRNDTQTHTLNPQVPFPEFQEISPF
ncbi:MAG: hypothetical protein HYW96_01305 [Candidatus Wildermuthbacteria bacterium]|nr:hypothetical protein [Candidatus Wildermuthbacteria bacterium]